MSNVNGRSMFRQVNGLERDISKIQDNAKRKQEADALISMLKSDMNWKVNEFMLRVKTRTLPSQLVVSQSRVNQVSRKVNTGNTLADRFNALKSNGVFAQPKQVIKSKVKSVAQPKAQTQELENIIRKVILEMTGNKG